MKPRLERGSAAIYRRERNEGLRVLEMKWLLTGNENVAAIVVGRP